MAARRSRRVPFAPRAGDGEERVRIVVAEILESYGDRFADAPTPVVRARAGDIEQSGSLREVLSDSDRAAEREEFTRGARRRHRMVVVGDPREKQVEIPPPLRRAAASSRFPPRSG